jgi:hypothetical protein
MTVNSDLVLDGPGNNDAYGHVRLDLTSFTGWITFSGGTGRISGFHAIVGVTCTAPAGTPCAWDGWYIFVTSKRRERPNERCCCVPEARCHDGGRGVGAVGVDGIGHDPAQLTPRINHWARVPSDEQVCGRAQLRCGASVRLPS